MQDQTSQHEIGKRPLAADAARVLLHALARLRQALARRAGGGRGLLAGLHAQAGAEDELADGGAEAGEEGVEGLGRGFC